MPKLTDALGIFFLEKLQKEMLNGRVHALHTDVPNSVSSMHIKIITVQIWFQQMLADIIQEASKRKKSSCPNLRKATEMSNPKER